MRFAMEKYENTFENTIPENRYWWVFWILFFGFTNMVKKHTGQNLHLICKISLLDNNLLSTQSQNG